MTLTCQFCGKGYSVKPYRASTSKACSRLCLAELAKDWMLGKQNRLGIPNVRARALVGTITKAGYRRFKQNRRQFFEHRMVWEAANGPIPDGFVIHHRDGNKLNNALDNLELMAWGIHSTEHGYSRTKRTGWNHSEQTRQKMSQSASNRSEATRERQRRAALARWAHSRNR